MFESAWNTAADWTQSAEAAFWAAVEVVMTFLGVLTLVLVVAGLASTVAPLALLCMGCG